MRNIVFIQHTMSPYRTEFFDLLHEQSNDKINFSTIYYKEMAKGRNWKIDKESISHNYLILKSVEIKIKGYLFYFTPKLFKTLLRNKNKEIILGVSWNDFNILILILLKRIGLLKNKLHFWSEANYMTLGMKKDNFLKKYIRKFVFNSIDGHIIIPGKISKITFEQYWNLYNKDYIFLPNIINVDFNSVGCKKLSNKIAILIVARLNENVKGILNFFKSIDREDLLKCEFFIAGDGNDRKLYEDYIKNEQLNNIHLLGNIDRSELLVYYKNCDLFILPSFSDPYPLSAVEAISAGKAILISNQCGNIYEVLNEGINGYSFNPYDEKDIFNKFKCILSKNLLEMGRKSFKISKDKFNPLQIVNKFIKEI